MADTFTTFLNLFKPDPTSFYDKSEDNNNMDKIDQGVKDAFNYFYITDTDTGTVYRCHEELRNGKPVLVYEEEV